jgi:hypothetical protein
MDLTERVWEAIDWINLAEDMDRWKAVGEHGNKLWFP